MIGPGAEMIGALLTGFAASRWMQAALHYSAIALAIVLFLLSIRRSSFDLMARP